MVGASQLPKLFPPSKKFRPLSDTFDAQAAFLFPDEGIAEHSAEIYVLPGIVKNRVAGVEILKMGMQISPISRWTTLTS